MEIKTVYEIEYVNDKKTWERVNYVIDNYCNLPEKVEPWELYSKKTFDNISDAISFYMPMLVNSNCYDIKMWCQVWIDGENVKEEFIDLDTCTTWRMKELIEKQLNDEVYKLRTTNALLSEESNKLREIYKRFPELKNMMEKSAYR